MRVLLVATNRMMTPFPVYPIGVDYVASALRDRHEVRVIDMAAEDAEARLEATCGELAPDVVGLSIRNVDSAETSHPDGFIPDLEKLVALIRRTCDARLVLGGPGFSIFPHALMTRLHADFGLTGEGERLPELLDALAGGTSDNVRMPGLFVGGKQSSPAENWSGPSDRMLASPDTVAHYLRWGGMLNIQTKRGCPFLCSYCTYPGIEGRSLRLFDPDGVAREWKTLVDAGARFVFVTDSVFNSHVRHNLAVAEALQRHRLRVPWGAFFAPTRPPTGYYARLGEVGLSHVEFGTESLAQAMLARYRKPSTFEHAQAAHREARAAGLHVAHYFLLGGPGETPETVAKTLDHCDAMDDAALFFFCGVRIYPSTAMHKLALHEGQVAPNEELLAPRFYFPGAITLDEIHDMVVRRSRGRRNWVIGSGDEQMAAILKRMYQRGHIGPLWDRLVTS
jgi:radical SAM superfamily enzyme YgiQ (UPF0313 family)